MKIKHYLSLIGIMAIAACTETKETTSKAPSNTSEIKSLIVPTEPADAQNIYSVRKSAKPGDSLTIKGKVMGRMEPFVHGRAIMILGDPEFITSCDLIPGDSCETPWDVCCDDPDVIKESTITVQVVDADGKLVKTGFKGIAGIKELSELVISGTVAEGSNKGNLLLNAQAIYVKP